MSCLSADSMQAVECLLAGNVTNHIRAEFIRESLKLYANGKLVASAMDSTYTSGGDAGLMAGTFNEGEWTSFLTISLLPSHNLIWPEPENV